MNKILDNNQVKDIKESGYTAVLQPLTINQATVPNRIVFPAIHTNYSNTDGTVSTKLINFYLKIAKGGCGLIFTGSVVVSKEGVGASRIMRADSDDCIDGLRKLFTAIEKHGSIPGIQLSHPGRQALKSVTGYDLLAPSNINCPVMSKIDPTYQLKVMTLDDITRVKNDFVDAAKRAAEAGAKIIEIHAAHGYLLAEFLSPYANHRTDQYGNSVENRCRIVCEIVSEIRNQLQDQIAISVRISGDEFVKNGLTPTDYQQIVPLLEAAGADMLHVSVGVAESTDHIIPNASFQEAPFIAITESIKKIATVPVCTVAGISSLDMAEKIIASGKADLVAIGRAQVADPELVKKTLTGRKDQITKCIRCNKCLYWATGETEMHCAVNSHL